ncbi:hypothetical protein C8R44DRAFT_882828 [Mycena epipterygia]|nr:hypothetical protein C8R44DRAFT_882828 [Mycena epipterygia]
MYWDASVYAGLRQFHRAKGFDPESQDVARLLGHPLFQISSKFEPPFAHVEGEFSGAEHDESTVDQPPEDVEYAYATAGIFRGWNEIRPDET